MFSLPELPYKFDALEPVIDARTMEIHYTKHHQGYVDKLNAALENYEDLMAEPIEELMRKIDEIPMEVNVAVRNNGGGHVNHSLFWTVMSKSGGKPSGELLEAIEKGFGSVEELREEFDKAALGRFGSGWAWLVVERGRLHVCSTANQDTPLSKGNMPILGLDVWEHAYYLSYKWQRAEYVKAWWNVVNWEQVEKNYRQAVANS